MRGFEVCVLENRFVVESGARRDDWSTFGRRVGQAILLMTDPYPQVVLLEGDRQVETRTLGAEPLTVGRMPDNTMCVKDVLVARFHFRVVRSGETWIAQDLGSNSGIWLNQQQVQSAKLVHGDEIRFGGHRLLFLAFADAQRLEDARLGKGRAAPRPGACPACWTTIARLRHEDALPEVCPRCRSTFIPADPAPVPNFIRTRFRLAISCTISELPCLVREPMPGPPLPRVTGVRVDGAAPLIPDSWGLPALRHATPLSALALTPDGLLRSGDAGGEVRTWDRSAARSWSVSRRRDPSWRCLPMDGSRWSTAASSSRCIRCPTAWPSGAWTWATRVGTARSTSRAA